MSEKVKIARVSVISNSSLFVLKLITGIISGSVSIISEAIHSGIDLIAAAIAFFSVRISDTPADEEHPYGHGKFENVSGVIEALLIFLAAGWIIYEALSKIFSKSVEIESLELGLGVMLFSAIVNFFVSRKLYKVARKTDSVALEADALHLKTDVYTSLGVFLALGIIWLTGWDLIDPIAAILVAVLIIKESYQLLIKAYGPLLDRSLTTDEINIIKDVLESFQLKYHDLKTRKSGQYRFAELHLELPSTKSLQDVHDICDKIEEEIKIRIKHIEINIHVEPLKENNNQ